MYIGETKNLSLRMINHQHDFQYTRIRWIKCDDLKRKEYEKRLIKIFKPLLNVAHNTNNKKRINPYEYEVFKKPVWIYNYDRMHLAAKVLSGLIADQIIECDWKYEYEKNKLDFEYLYNKKGFKNTILDESYW